jgi:hypothetical protein
MEGQTSFATLSSFRCPICDVAVPHGPFGKYPNVALSDHRDGTAGAELRPCSRGSGSSVQLARTIDGEVRRRSQTEGATQCRGPWCA